MMYEWYCILMAQGDGRGGVEGFLKGVVTVKK